MLDPHFDQNVEVVEGMQCRICFGSPEDEPLEEGNYFISPCDCAGTSKYVHYQCLKHWLEKKIKK
jgi:E3 ubiquitin-protein ligase DOA10